MRRCAVLLTATRTNVLASVIWLSSFGVGGIVFCGLMGQLRKRLSDREIFVLGEPRRPARVRNRTVVTTLGPNQPSRRWVLATSPTIDRERRQRGREARVRCHGTAGPCAQGGAPNASNFDAL